MDQRKDTSARRQQDPDEDHRLVELYLGGDAETLGRVEAWIHAELDARYSGPRHEREDLLQAVHQKLLLNLREGRFRHGASLKTYVSRISRYTAIDLLRKRYRERQASRHVDASDFHASEAADPLRIAEDTEREKLLQEALALSPESCRELWRMVFLERLSYREIGQRLEISPGTVKSRTWNCRRKLLALVRRLGTGRSQPSRLSND